MLSDDIDYSLVPYTRRSMVETMASHVGLLVAAPIVVWVTDVYVPGVFVHWAASAALLALLLINTGIACGCAYRTMSMGLSYDHADRWDVPTTTVAFLIALGLSIFAGGLAGPVPVLVLILVTYATSVYSGLVVRFLGVIIAAGVVVVGLVTDTWAGEGMARGIGLCILAIVLATLTDLMTMGMLRAQFDAARTKEEIAEDVTRMSKVADEVASGDLRATMTSTKLHSVSTTQLASRLDRTFGSLRTLVGRVRSGGDQIGSAAEQVLVAAREQAASASQQSSAVSETTATIEELAATAAQIAETVGAGGGVCVGDVGVCGAGSGGGGGFGGCDGFDCVSGGSDCVSCFGVGGEGAGDWSDFGGD